MQWSSTQNTDEIRNEHRCYNIWADQIVGGSNQRKPQRGVRHQRKDYKKFIKQIIKYRFSTNLRSSLSNLGLLFLDICLGKELTGANLSLIERNCERMKLKSPPSCLQESEKISESNGAAHAVIRYNDTKTTGRPTNELTIKLPTDRKQNLREKIYGHFSLYN